VHESAFGHQGKILAQDRVVIALAMAALACVKRPKEVPLHDLSSANFGVVRQIRQYPAERGYETDTMNAWRASQGRPAPRADDPISLPGNALW
jgi:hypothetical protein